MPHGDKKTPAARAETDASLQAERAKTDKELDRHSAQVGEGADAVVRTARAQADAVLDDGRHQTDNRSSGKPTDQVREERSRQDAAIAEERKVADATLEAERVQRHIALASLLAFERSETDSRLRVERERVDEVLSHRDDFLAMLSHDMRTLLGNIALNAAMLERQGQHDPAVARHTASIQRTTAQMTRLVADLLDVATIDAGKLVLVRQRLDAAQLVRQGAEAFELIASGRNISISVDVSDGDLTADVDPDRIAQVLANLIGNAAKFTSPGGKITVGAARRERDVCFFVADNGEGIPPEKLETIFERYSQAGRADRRGLGLGLYISQKIIEAHGGRLWAESVWRQGSTFSFCVPAPAEESP